MIQVKSVLSVKDEPEAPSFVTRIVSAESIDEARKFGRILLSESRPHWSLIRSVWIWDGEQLEEVKR